MQDDKLVAGDENSDVPQFFKRIRIATPGSPQDLKNPGALPPKDSWVVLDPGTEFELNAKTQEEWLAKVKKFRRIRGNFLAACFDLEFTIDSIIGEVFFPKPRVENSERLKSVFDDVFLKTRSFGKKIALLEKLLKELPSLVHLIPTVILPDLKDIVQIRNGFAHFPIVFKPLQDTETVAPFLALKYPPLALNESFFKKYGTLIPKVSSTLSSALQILSKDDISPAAAAGNDSTSGNTGAVYLGHSIVNTDIADWMLE
jgi:hypothetical protein